MPIHAALNDDLEANESTDTWAGIPRPFKSSLAIDPSVFPEEIMNPIMVNTRIAKKNHRFLK
jgi:hypothetical protein